MFIEKIDVFAVVALSRDTCALLAEACAAALEVIGGADREADVRLLRVMGAAFEALAHAVRA